jgi:Ca2+-binding RTX toxin-like protein
MPLATWLDTFKVNETADAGTQNLAVSAGLSNGNILVLWVDDTNNVDSAAGTDIIAQIFDPLGTAIGDAFQINTFAELDHETDPDVMAMPNGRFMVVYEQNANDGDSDIHYQIFDANLNIDAEGNVALGAAGADQVRNPVIAFKPIFGEQDFGRNYVMFDRTSLGNTDVNGMFVNVGGQASTEFDAGQNSNDFDREPDSAVIGSSGQVVTVYEENDNGTTSLEFSLYDPDTLALSIVPLPFPGDDPHIAARNDDFMIVYTSTAGDITTMLFDAGGNSLNGVFTFGSGADTFDQPAVAAHAGGYVVVWRNSTDDQIYAQALTSAGGPDGMRLTIATHPSVSRPELSVLTDGRIVITWEQGTDIYSKILDSRSAVINGTNADETITSRVDGATVNGLVGNDRLLGVGANDTLNGGSGDDILDGGAGADHMAGGIHDDTYYVDQVMDATIEALNEGTDTVNAFITHALRINIEELTLRGAANINGTGNALDNIINGNNGSNILNGLGGADVMQGGAGNDTYYVDNDFDLTLEGAGQGSDIVHATLDWGLSPEIERLYLHGDAVLGTGNAIANYIHGNANNNIINGMAGADRGWGYQGDDTYIKDSAGDLFYETIAGAAGGIDLVESSVNHTLGTNFENLTLTGAGNVNATGNTLVNVIVGSSGNNYIDGKAAADTLTGGLGADQFLFTTALGADNIDTVTDFDPAADFIRLENAIFTTLPVGFLAVAAFHTGAAAADAADRIIYNSATGALLYDSDGTGGAAAIQFATLSTGLAMTNADVFVF